MPPRSLGTHSEVKGLPMTPSDIAALKALVELVAQQATHDYHNGEYSAVEDDIDLAARTRAAMPALKRLLEAQAGHRTKNFNELRDKMSPESQARANAMTDKMLKEMVQPNPTPEVLPWMSRAADAIADIYLPNCPVAHRLSIEYQIARFAPYAAPQDWQQGA